MKSLSALVMLGTLPGAVAAPEPISFITCPVYRDTDAGRKSGCWLADDRDSGVRYDVSAAPSKPDWNHEVLVEGLLGAPAPEHCGGIVLDPVRTSILSSTCPRHMLPAEGYKGNRFSLPARNVAPMAVARAVPPPPYAPRTFRLFFSFDSAFLLYQYDDFLLDRAITWIRAAKPRAIVVTGFADAEPRLVSGRRVAEDPAIARERADRVVEALTRLGVDRATIVERAETRALPVDDVDADGLVDASRRRVEIAVRF